MKKFILILSLLCFGISGTVNFANAANPQYSAEIAVIRNIKNAKMKPINAQINKLKQNIETCTLDTSLSEAEKEKKIESYKKELTVLETKKTEINKKYNQDKKQIKSKYKFGGLVN